MKKLLGLCPIGFYRMVKRADLSHNSDPIRLPAPEDDDDGPWQQQRMEKYRKAITYLSAE